MLGIPYGVKSEKSFVEDCRGRIRAANGFVARVEVRMYWLWLVQHVDCLP